MPKRCEDLLGLSMVLALRFCKITLVLLPELPSFKRAVHDGVMRYYRHEAMDFMLQIQRYYNRGASRYWEPDPAVGPTESTVKLALPSIERASNLTRKIAAAATKSKATPKVDATKTVKAGFRNHGIGSEQQSSGSGDNTQDSRFGLAKDESEGPISGVETLQQGTLSKPTSGNKLEQGASVMGPDSQSTSALVDITASVSFSAAWVRSTFTELASTFKGASFSLPGAITVPHTHNSLQVEAKNPFSIDSTTDQNKSKVVSNEGKEHATPTRFLRPATSVVSVPAEARVSSISPAALDLLVSQRHADSLRRAQVISDKELTVLNMPLPGSTWALGTGPGNELYQQPPASIAARYCNEIPLEYEAAAAAVTEVEATEPAAAASIASVIDAPAQMMQLLMPSTVPPIVVTAPTPSNSTHSEPAHSTPSMTLSSTSSISSASSVAVRMDTEHLQKFATTSTPLSALVSRDSITSRDSNGARRTATGCSSDSGSRAGGSESGPLGGSKQLLSVHDLLQSHSIEDSVVNGTAEIRSDVADAKLMDTAVARNARLRTIQEERMLGLGRSDQRTTRIILDSASLTVGTSHSQDSERGPHHQRRDCTSAIASSSVLQQPGNGLRVSTFAKVTTASTSIPSHSIAADIAMAPMIKPAAAIARTTGTRNTSSVTNTNSTASSPARSATAEAERRLQIRLGKMKHPSYGPHPTGSLINTAAHNCAVLLEEDEVSEEEKRLREVVEERTRLVMQRIFGRDAFPSPSISKSSSLAELKQGADRALTLKDDLSKIADTSTRTNTRGMGVTNPITPVADIRTGPRLSKVRSTASIVTASTASKATALNLTPLLTPSSAACSTPAPSLTTVTPVSIPSSLTTAAFVATTEDIGLPQANFTREYKEDPEYSLSRNTSTSTSTTSRSRKYTFLSYQSSLNSTKAEKRTRLSNAEAAAGASKSKVKSIVHQLNEVAAAAEAEAVSAAVSMGSGASSRNSSVSTGTTPSRRSSMFAALSGGEGAITTFDSGTADGVISARDLRVLSMTGQCSNAVKEKNMPPLSNWAQEERLDPSKAASTTITSAKGTTTMTRKSAARGSHDRDQGSVELVRLATPRSSSSLRFKKPAPPQKNSSARYHASAAKATAIVTTVNQVYGDDDDDSDGPLQYLDVEPAYDAEGWVLKTGTTVTEDLDQDQDNERQTQNHEQEQAKHQDAPSTGSTCSVRQFDVNRPRNAYNGAGGQRQHAAVSTRAASIASGSTSSLALGKDLRAYRSFGHDNAYEHNMESEMHAHTGRLFPAECKRNLVPEHDNNHHKHKNAEPPCPDHLMLRKNSNYDHLTSCSPVSSTSTSSVFYQQQQQQQQQQQAGRRASASISLASISTHTTTTLSTPCILVTNPACTSVSATASVHQITLNSQQTREGLSAVCRMHSRDSVLGTSVAPISGSNLAPLNVQEAAALVQDRRRHASRGKHANQQH
ncbi:hypothetical protein EDD11_008642 [Mortierella claussenii]|nr:hypothetical protein EDD11_008642 [Mortierella claussenii]